VRRSIEAELDRCRIELSGMRTLARDTEQDGQAAFEVEKLLGALKTTMDQMSASIAVAGNATSRCAALCCAVLCCAVTCYSITCASVTISTSDRIIQVPRTLPSLHPSPSLPVPPVLQEAQVGHYPSPDRSRSGVKDRQTLETKVPLPPCPCLHGWI
jgi:hypothetical protein